MPCHTAFFVNNPPNPTPMLPLSMELRERILAAYDAGEGTRETIAARFGVSLGMVKKLLQLRSNGKGIGPDYHRCGRKATITHHHRQQLRDILAQNPGMTLGEMREKLGVSTTIQAIQHTLADMGLTYRQRRTGPRKRPVSRKNNSPAPPDIPM